MFGNTATFGRNALHIKAGLSNVWILFSVALIGVASGIQWL